MLTRTAFRSFAFFILVAGCAVPENKNCLDWKHYKTRQQTCTPIYGNLICVEQDVIKHYCVLWEESDVANITRPDNESDR